MVVLTGEKWHLPCCNAHVLSVLSVLLQLPVCQTGDIILLELWVLRSHSWLFSHVEESLLLLSLKGYLDRPPISDILWYYTTNKFPDVILELLTAQCRTGLLSHLVDVLVGQLSVLLELRDLGLSLLLESLKRNLLLPLLLLRLWSIINLGLGADKWRGAECACDEGGCDVGGWADSDTTLLAVPGGHAQGGGCRYHFVYVEGNRGVDCGQLSERCDWNGAPT